METHTEEHSVREHRKHLYHIAIKKGYIEYIQKHHPDVDVDSILRYAGISPFEFQDPGYWFTQEQSDRFQEICIEKTGNPDISRESGRLVANGNSFKTLRQFFLVS